MDIGSKIREARIAKGLTQEELGKILGVQKSAIAKYENGRVINIKRSTLQKLSEVLGIRPAELFFDEVQKNNDTITDAVIRMRTDPVFFSVVKDLLCINNQKLSGLSAFLKQFMD